MTTAADPDAREKIAAELQGAIRNALSTGGLRGTVAARVVREILPTFDPQLFGFRSLKDFVLAIVPGARVVGRAGVDVVYGLDGEEPGVRVASSPTQAAPHAWKTWVSPASDYCLEMDPAGTVTVVARGATASLGGVLMAPATYEAHRALASDFLTSHPSVEAPELKAQLAESLRGTPGWWWSWMRRLRGTPSINAAWLEFRRDRLEVLLRDQLAQTALSSEAQERALHQIIASRRLSVAGVARDDLRSVALRRVAHAVVDRLTERELRQLLLPLGLVHDALKART